MRIVDDIREDWKRTRKWFSEVRNFLLFTMLLSAFIMSAMWLFSVQVVNIAVIIGIVAMVGLIGTIVGNYAYIWYIQKQSKEKDEKIEELSQKLRQTEDENLVLKIKLEETMKKETTEPKTVQTTANKDAIAFLNELRKIGEQGEEDKVED